MAIQDKEGPIWEDNQTQILPMRPWRHAEMGGELLGDLLPSGQLDVYQGHSYSENNKIAPHQVSRFFPVLHPGCCKTKIFMELPIWFGVEGYQPRE